MNIASQTLEDVRLGSEPPLPDQAQIVDKATLRLTVRNTGNLTWPVGPTVLGTSGPRERTSASYGPPWLSARRPGRMPREMVDRSIELFGKEVIPAFAGVHA